jgi:membrane fusion protein (multidrug efflux system)
MLLNWTVAPRIAASALVIAGLFGASAWADPPAPVVTVAPVVVRNIAPAQSYVGHVIAIQQVQIVPRVTAFIDAVPVKQGSNVKAGQVLFQLQKAQYENAVEAAQAQLASAEAALKLAEVSLTRAQQLAKRQFESVANLNQAEATQAQDQANVEAAQANLAQARLNLSYCTITSPIEGRIGAIALTKGNLVTPTTPTMATVVQIDPIRVVFPVSDQAIVAAEKRSGASASNIAKALVVHLTLPDGSAYGHRGTVAFFENVVQQQTGTVNIYADFPNPDGFLLPGAFVNVAVSRAKPEERALVPVEAVQTEQHGSYVLVVGTDNKVRQQPVELGRQIAQNYIVNKGLAAGDRVIIAGVQKVKPGEIVKTVAAPAVAATGSVDDSE